jgi:hypothetical protein
MASLSNNLANLTQQVASPLPFDLSTLLKKDLNNNEFSLNGHLYDVELYITNKTGTRYNIPSTAVISLKIVDTLSNWIVDGEITIYYDNDLAESLGFYFLNNGEDILRVRIVPKDIATTGLNSLNVDANKFLWQQNYIFAIKDVHDVTPPTSGGSKAKSLKKFKKFFFHDIRYQIMLTRNLEYSSAFTALQASQANGQGTPKAASNQDRSLLTGDIMDELIKLSLGGDELIAKTGKDLNRDWDTGAYKHFYTSPASENAFSDLMYIYSRHVSSKTKNPMLKGNDYCLLTIEDDGEAPLGYFALIPLSTYFDKAGNTTPGDYQIEHFFLQADAPNNNTSVNKILRAPIDNISTTGTKDIKIADINTITSYEYVDISPLVNSTLYNITPVYSFDFKNRSFNIEFNNHSYTAANDLINQNYINKLRISRSATDKNSLLCNDTNVRQHNYNVRPVFSEYGEAQVPESRLSDGLHKLLQIGLFQNTCINFTVAGATFRKPGRFIGIDRPDGSIDSSADDKLCGQWFVINVEHMISNSAYYNNITAVKLHRFNPQPF